MKLKLSKYGADFSKEELGIGTKNEMEHFEDDRLKDAIKDEEPDDVAAAQIAKVHLEESPRYYEFLGDMEKLMKKDKGAHNLSLGNRMAGVAMDNVKIQNMKFCLWSIVKDLDKISIVEEHGILGNKDALKAQVAQSMADFHTLYNQVFGE